MADRADVTPDEHIEAARLVLTVEVASELEVATAEDLVFPRSIRIERPDHSETFFPGWPGSVLLLAHENQGVCSFGLSLDGLQAGAVVVGGEIEGEIGTMVHAADLGQFVWARLWDARQGHQTLLQAQAAPLDDRSVTYLRGRFKQRASTAGWPCRTTLRFEGDAIMICLWSCVDQCDWFISGTIESLRREVPRLRRFSNLDAALWSNDAPGIELLRNS